eukprot:11169360-Lingulodinium_polyedra.AAC.1
MFLMGRSTRHGFLFGDVSTRSCARHYRATTHFCQAAEGVLCTEGRVVEVIATIERIEDVAEGGLAGLLR